MKKSMREYYDWKKDFFTKHSLENVETSSMDEYSNYHKTYTTSDGLVVIECNGPVWIDVEFTANIDGIEIKKTEKVKFFQSEVWTSKDPVSNYYIEKWN